MSLVVAEGGFRCIHSVCWLDSALSDESEQSRCLDICSEPTEERQNELYMGSANISPIVLSGNNSLCVTSGMTDQDETPTLSSCRASPFVL